MKTNVLFSSIHQDIIGSDLLTKSQTIDSNANGIQLTGAPQVTKVALGVSCNLEFLQKAVEWGAQVCIFHHGIGLNSNYIFNSMLLPSTQKELSFALEHNLTIAGYHYTLDAHPSIGNNVLIIKELGAIETYEEYFDSWGWIGEFEQPRLLTELAQLCSKLFKHDVFIVKGEKELIKRIGVCSGGAIPRVQQLWEIQNKQIDLHITGEIKESTPSLFQEMGISYLACGHYATEMLGVKFLGKQLSKHFPKLETKFIEVWNAL